MKRILHFPQNLNNLKCPVLRIYLFIYNLLAHSQELMIRQLIKITQQHDNIRPYLRHGAQSLILRAIAAEVKVKESVDAVADLGRELRVDVGDEAD